MTFLLPIIASDIDLFWPRIRHLIEKPLIKTDMIHDYLPDDIRDLCKSRDMQCWAAHDGHRIVCVAITQILVYPRRKVLGVPFVGAESGHMATWLQHLDAIKEFGREHDCEALRVWGRKGWERVLAPKTVRIEADIDL